MPLLYKIIFIQLPFAAASGNKPNAVTNGNAQKKLNFCRIPKQKHTIAAKSAIP